jgi:hypothetical protein
MKYIAKDIIFNLRFRYNFRDYGILYLGWLFFLRN